MPFYFAKLFLLVWTVSDCAFEGGWWGSCSQQSCCQGWAAPGNPGLMLRSRTSDTNISVPLAHGNRPGGMISLISVKILHTLSPSAAVPGKTFRWHPVTRSNQWNPEITWNPKVLSLLWIQLVTSQYVLPHLDNSWYCAGEINDPLGNHGTSTQSKKCL